MSRLHATCVAIEGRGVLLRGRSGSGKSDLALRLIDGGAVLVSDDYTEVIEEDGHLVASPPLAIEGMLEVRGIGVVRVPFLARAVLTLVVELVSAGQVPRMPEPETVCVADRSGIGVPLLRLDPFQASAEAKVRLAVRTPMAAAGRADG